MDPVCSRSSCGEEQSLPTGVTACRACRFALVIEVEEPRCACGYLLYQLRGDTRPECGLEIPARDRWSQAGEDRAPSP